MLATLDRLEDRLETLEHTERRVADPDRIRRALSLLLFLIMVATIVAAVSLGLTLTQQH